MKSWINYNNECDFSIYNIPFGIYSKQGGNKRVASIIGDKVIDIYELFKTGYLAEFPNLNSTVLENDFLNDFISLGKETTTKVREKIQFIFSTENGELNKNSEHQQSILKNTSEVELHLPIKIENYTDFYSSMDHARNVGTMFRDPENALLPNWKHLPVGYHGRASSITVSGTNFHRPMGQTKAPDAENPVFGPSKLLDFELEMGFVIGKNSELGNAISTDEAGDYIFGLSLFNDWSARDIQTWEYVPLGPFLSKNFCSTLSPWIVTIEALEPFRIKGPEQNPKVLDYLSFKKDFHFDVNLEVAIKPENSEETVVSNSNFKFMYWNMLQQLAHHTVNGCNIKVGDLYASGTISGPEKGSYGSMLEITWRGTQPVKMKDGSERKFINDNDTVTLRGFAMKDNIRVGFGKAEAKALPAKVK
jgi:fumarylacetoacetase